MFSSLISAGVAKLTVAMLVKNVPGGVSDGTLTTNVKALPLVTGRLGFVQVMVPFVPTAGVEHDHPAGEASETKVKPAGNGSFN